MQVSGEGQDREERSVGGVVHQADGLGEVEIQPGGARTGEQSDNSRPADGDGEQPRPDVEVPPCKFCDIFSQRCTCTDEKRATDDDKFRARLIEIRAIAEGNLRMNPFQFAYERKRIEEIDKHL